MSHIGSKQGVCLVVVIAVVCQLSFVFVVSRAERMGGTQSASRAATSPILVAVVVYVWSVVVVVVVMVSCHLHVPKSLAR